MRVFMGRPEVTAEFMLDVLRQYACPWEDLDATTTRAAATTPPSSSATTCSGIEIRAHETHVADQLDLIDSAGQREVLLAVRTCRAQQG